MTRTAFMQRTARVRQILADAISPEGRERRELAERALDRDPLTGLANLTAFKKAERSAARDREVAFVMFDGDHFGHVNKELGQRMGDEWIKSLAFAITSAVDKHGYGQRVFRIGGDEFVVLLPWRLAGVVRDEAEWNFWRFKRPLQEMGLSGGIGNNLDEADSHMRLRKLWNKRQRKNPDYGRGIGCATR